MRRPHSRDRLLQPLSHTKVVRRVLLYRLLSVRALSAIGLVGRSGSHGGVVVLAPMGQNVVLCVRPKRV